MDLLIDASGWLEYDGHLLRCALGKGGIKQDKREGDGASPAGSWPLRRVFYRPDRLAAFPCALPLSPLSPQDGWCDDPGHPDYNRPVSLPHPASCEQLWREDSVYDVIVVLAHNDDPPQPGLGSAIFMHVARPGYLPTEGCVALALPDLLWLLQRVSPTDAVVIPAR